MESRIDEKYRLLVLQYCLENAVEKTMVNGQPKWVFTCPFCGPLGRTEGKKKHCKGALLWNSTQHSWVFHCAKGGSVQCCGGKSFANFLSLLNPQLGEQYRQERWHSGTTGQGHNCGAPRVVRRVGVTSTP